MKLLPDGVGVAEGLELACVPLPCLLPVFFMRGLVLACDRVEDRVEGRVEACVCDGVEARDGDDSNSISACVRSRRMLAVIRRTLLGLSTLPIILEADDDGVGDCDDADDAVVVLSSPYRDRRFEGTVVFLFIVARGRPRRL